MCQVCPRIQQPKWKRHHFQFSQLKLTLRAALAQPSAPKSISSLLPSPRRQQHNFFVSMFLLGAPEQEMVQHVQVLVQELQALFFFELFFALLFSLFFSAVMLSFLLLLCEKMDSTRLIKARCKKSQPPQLQFALWPVAARVFSQPRMELKKGQL